MKKTMVLEFEKGSINGLNKNKRLHAIMEKFLDSYKPIGEFIIQQVFKHKNEPRKMLITLEIKQTGLSTQFVTSSHTLFKDL